MECVLFPKFASRTFDSTSNDVFCVFHGTQSESIATSIPESFVSSLFGPIFGQGEKQIVN